MNLRASQLETLRAVEDLSTELLYVRARAVAGILGVQRTAALSRLDRLEALGYLRANKTSPAWRVFELTDQGRAALAQEGNDG